MGALAEGERELVLLAEAEREAEMEGTTLREGEPDLDPLLLGVGARGVDVGLVEGLTVAEGVTELDRDLECEGVIELEGLTVGVIELDRVIDGVID